MTQSDRPSRIFVAALRGCMWIVILLGLAVFLPMVLLKKKWRVGLRERLGGVREFAPHPLRLWVHAISVGETEAARPLVAALREKYPQAEIVLSSTTQTGRARARQLMPDVTHILYPLDVPWAVSRTLGRVKPTAIIMVEAEWWPVFLLTAARRGLPLVMVNVRMTEKAIGGYRRIGGLMRRMLRAPAAIGVQEEIYAERLRQLGADGARIRVTGQMKYDNVQVAGEAGAGRHARPAAAEELAASLGLGGDERLVVAGSTGPGEEEILLDAYARVRQNLPDARLAIIPRKPERFDEVAELIRSRHLPLIRRSEMRGGTGGAASASGRIGSAAGEAVILGDTMGELMNFYALGRVAFVGRSLVPLGGSNPIDPASLGLPLLFGPQMFNFPDAEELFVAGGGARVVTDAGTLAAAMTELLSSPELAAEMGGRARAAIVSRQGATGRNVDLIDGVLRAAGKV
jgi:3-deoxy-D-manno-octulosonic-acid transferase